MRGIEDDYDAEFCYTSSPQPSLQSLDGPATSSTSFRSVRPSSPLCASAASSFRPSSSPPFAALKSVVDDYSPLIDQATLASFLESGAFYAHIRRCRRHYAERQSLFLELAKKHELPLTFPITRRGINLAGMLPKRSNDQLWSDRLETAGLDIPALSSYALKPTPPGLLFGLAAFDQPAIQRAVARMAQVFERRGST